MAWTDYFGYFGAFLTAITFVPQVIRAWQTKSVGDLSIYMLMIVFTSALVWLVYAFALHLVPVIVANSIVFILTVVLIYFKLTFKKSS
jgi:MtN3 and saliva related transmembrane protein